MDHILYSMCLRPTADCEFFTQNVLALEGIWSSLWGLNVKYVEIPIVFDKKELKNVHQLLEAMKARHLGDRLLSIILTTLTLTPLSCRKETLSATTRLSATGSKHICRHVNTSTSSSLLLCSSHLQQPSLCYSYKSSDKSCL